MSREDIIKMAREAGSIDSEEVIETVWNAFSAAEREACAKVCDDWPNGRDDVCLLADAIRARGEK